MTESVITALSDFARMPDPVLANCNLQDCIDDAIKTVSLPEFIKLSVEIPEDLPAVIIDRAQTPIVFRNLIRNARDAMPSGGIIRIVAEAKQYARSCLSDRQRRRHPGRTAQSNPRAAVHDQGPRDGTGIGDQSRDRRKARRAS